MNIYPNIGYVRIYGHFLKIEELFLTKIMYFLNICNITNTQWQYYPFFRQGHFRGYVTLPLSHILSDQAELLFLAI